MAQLDEKDGNNPFDSEVYAKALKSARMRRRFFFGTVMLYIPSLIITRHFSPTNRAMATVFGVWVVFLIFFTFWAALSKCPRCGNLFHVNGMTLLFLRKCLHCQLHISSDKTM